MGTNTGVLRKHMGQNKETNPLINLAAGGVSGAVSKTITAPLEKVKLAIQNQDSNPRILSGEMKRYTGMANCFMRHITELGPTSLWRGNVANCIRYVPTAAFNLAFKDNIKKLFPKYNKNTDFGKEKKYNGMLDCLKKTVKANGFLSLYNGIGPSSIGIVVYRGAQFGLQDILKAFNPYQKEVSAIGLASKFIVAQVAVSFSGVVSYPFDTLQRRLQIEASKPEAEKMYTGMADCAKKIMKAEGPGGFFKGALANVLRGTGAAIVLAMYDEIINFVTRD